MAPTDAVHLPFRWEFEPVRNPADGAIHWQWRAFTHSGSLAMESEHGFETLTDCVDDAKRFGFHGN
jgi:hypothetical protein